jgi:hypothetical protein
VTQLPVLIPFITGFSLTSWRNANSAYLYLLFPGIMMQKLITATYLIPILVQETSGLNTGTRCLS